MATVAPFAIVVAWLGTPFLLSLLLGKTLWRLTVYDRRIDPDGYWRVVRLWGIGWAFTSLFVVATAFLPEPSGSLTAGPASLHHP